MGQLGEVLSFGFQARLELDRGARTLVELLRERMDGVDRSERRPTLKERLGLNLKGLGCCGATWAMNVRDGDEVEEDVGGPLSPQVAAIMTAAQDPVPSPPCAAQTQATTGMNLAAALAAERQLRAADGGGNLRPSSSEQSDAPARVSLMRLLEETERKEEDGSGNWVCCVCMGREKGAAFIPCGHTFCRVCSREVWLNRGACPLCNRPILEILDIY